MSWIHDSLLPRLLVDGEKKSLVAHVRNYPLLNTCLGKSGRGLCILIQFTKYTSTIV